MAALGVGLAACSEGNDPQVGELGFISGFAGFVAADDARAVLIGQDVLSAGGRAADAAVAMAFTMAVTMPSSVGIGGGGVCVSFEPDLQETKAFLFLPGAPSAWATADSLSGDTAARVGVNEPVALPGFARGLFALHAKHGRLRWESLLSEAEGLARFGHPVSRALAQRAQAYPAAADLFAQDLAAANTLSGTPDPYSATAVTGLPEGSILTQRDLAHVIGSIRAKGAGAMYGGTLAGEIEAAAASVGMALPRAAMRDYLPQVVDTRSASAGNDLLHVPPMPASALSGLALYTGQAAGAGAASSAGIEAPYEASAGLVAADVTGGGVACSFTMGRPFGTGRVVPGKGILTVPASAVDGIGQGLVPMVVSNEFVREVQAVMTTNGPGADRVAATLAQDLVRGSRTSPTAVSQAVGMSGPTGARVNAGSCVEAISRSPETCLAAHDPRGAGFSSVAGQN
ncbi:MAG: gamma-glutamyltransferase [Rhodospirillaceae bacterium]